jgi:hypothetical protein
MTRLINVLNFKFGLIKDFQILPMDTIVLQGDKRVYSGNNFIIELVSACKEKIESMSLKKTQSVIF